MRHRSRLRGAQIFFLCAGQDVLVLLKSEEERTKNPFLHSSPLLLEAGAVLRYNEWGKGGSQHGGI